MKIPMEKRTDSDINTQKNGIVDSEENDIVEDDKLNSDNDNPSADNEAGGQVETEILGEEYFEAEADESESENSSDKLISDLEKKYKDSEEKYLRILAEFANFKKRLEREKEEMSAYLRGDIIKKMLPVLDDFKIMIEKSTDESNEDSVIEGAKIIFDKFVQILEKEGLTRIDAVDQPFDPEIHEALMMKPIDNEDEHNKIVEVFQEGYFLRDKLLRPTKVVVGNFQPE